MPLHKNWLVRELGMVASPMWTTVAPTFTDSQYTGAPVGAEVVYTNVASDGNSGIVINYQKVGNAGTTSDWQGYGCTFNLEVGYGDFTDGGGTSGTFEMSNDIPAGSYVSRTIVRNVTGFTGDTSATLTVGDGTDVDRYMTGTPSVFTTAAMVAMGVPSGTRDDITTETPTLTVTSASDFGAVEAGQLDIWVYFWVQA